MTTATWPSTDTSGWTGAFVVTPPGARRWGASTPPAMFQVQPNLTTQCNILLAQTSHPGAINVGFADGSVRPWREASTPARYGGRCSLRRRATFPPPISDKETTYIRCDA